MFFDKFTDHELYEIYRSAVNHEWHELLGPEPDGFNSIPEVRSTGWRGRKIKRVKRDYTGTITGVIWDILGPEKMEAMRMEYTDDETRLHELILQNVPIGSPVSVGRELRILFQENGKDACD